MRIEHLVSRFLNILYFGQLKFCLYHTQYPQSPLTPKFWQKKEAKTVRWIEVKVAVLFARQYMPWNLLLIKVLNKFWYFKHQIPTGTFSEAYL